MYPLTSIQVHKFPSYIYPGHVSNSSTSPILMTHIPPVHVSPQSSSRYLHLTPTQMMSHLHPCPRILVSPPSRYCFTSIQAQKFFSHHDPYRGSHLSKVHLSQIQVEIWVSPPSTPHLISILAHRFTSIQVVSHLNPGLYICVPSSSRWRLSSNQVTKIASLFHPGNISNQSRSQDVRLTSLQVLPDQHQCSCRTSIYAPSTSQYSCCLLPRSISPPSQFWHAVFIQASPLTNPTC